MATDRVFITMASEPPRTFRLAVKDNIDVQGLPTTLGSRVMADEPTAAPCDAACVTKLRRAGAQVVGKANMVELALGAHGINPWFGTPQNPIDGRLIPGGSSSGSAVAVAEGIVDLALGTDTGGSVRIPAACCGIVGLKPSSGVIPADGVAGLAPTMDAVGPLARNVAGVARAMAVLAPVMDGSDEPPDEVVLVTDGAVPEIRRAIVRALLGAGFRIREQRGLLNWEAAWRAGSLLLEHEAADLYRSWIPRADRLDPGVAQRLRRGAGFARQEIDAARGVRQKWTAALKKLLDEPSRVLITPTLPVMPPSLDHGRDALLNWFTLPINLAGLSALALPVPMEGGVPTSLQVVASAESTVIAVGRRIEMSFASEDTSVRSWHEDTDIPRWSATSHQ